MPKRHSSSKRRPGGASTNEDGWPDYACQILFEDGTFCDEDAIHGASFCSDHLKSVLHLRADGKSPDSMRLYAAATESDKDTKRVFKKGEYILTADGAALMQRLGHSFDCPYRGEWTYTHDHDNFSVDFLPRLTDSTSKANAEYTVSSYSTACILYATKDIADGEEICVVRPSIVTDHVSGGNRLSVSKLTKKTSAAASSGGAISDNSNHRLRRVVEGTKDYDTVMKVAEKAFDKLTSKMKVVLFAHVHDFEADEARQWLHHNEIPYRVVNLEHDPLHMEQALQVMFDDIDPPLIVINGDAYPLTSDWKEDDYIVKKARSTTRIRAREAAGIKDDSESSE
ncbi:uncharacterized protein BJ171DRAFT_580069 [Polychytrium aggregatum]|uniref:uncharacterized protein n=1 Tax=Polychytrium aggregatum TaxID=110093 RepID=UPI0022FEC0C9|nr:uncharacterized protein BJ171DRAFT_580069 [Polychytrium aggregatum]KAI9205995.1 hypothetical protein BJ171DRAFT_580069 [Polychytrium aggregatum]